MVFDGNCGFCTRAVGWVRVLDRHGRIELHPWQGPGVLERFGLTPEQGNTTVWAVPAEHVTPVGSGTGTGTGTGTQDGATHGARAVSAILDTALGTRCFGAFYGLPLAGRSQEAVYRWVAAHRGSFPGVTPWCEQHPGQCGSGR
ncbi:DUF393 domain-containing protein [Kocuria tytonis]|uniref:DUF393 domain-containing protein n=1 Tax=Kocuria tytonis TaxID=2054280 RepID=A0A495AC71_9MICC|nr:DUF393 domain-containing protein [Kocuria tytonis]